MSKEEWIESYVEDYIKQTKRSGLEYNETYIRKQFTEQYQLKEEKTYREDGTVVIGYVYNIKPN